MRQNDEKLIAAIKSCDEEAVGEALALGASPDARDERGWAAALIAADLGEAGILKALVGAGAELKTAVDSRGCSAPVVALAGGTGKKQRLACLRVLQAAGVDLDAKSPAGTTALMMAAIVGDEKCVERLICAGVDLDAKNFDGISAPLFAAIRGHDKALMALARAGANLGGSDPHGRSVKDLLGIHFGSRAQELWAALEKIELERASPRAKSSPGARL